MENSKLEFDKNYHILYSKKCEKEKTIYYEFTTCPVALFAKQFGLTDIMPALCNVDYKSMELIKATLIGKGTIVDSDKCDYTICGNKDSLDFYLL